MCLFSMFLWIGSIIVVCQLANLNVFFRKTFYQKNVLRKEMCSATIHGIHASFCEHSQYMCWVYIGNIVQRISRVYGHQFCFNAKLASNCRLFIKLLQNGNCIIFKSTKIVLFFFFQSTTKKNQIPVPSVENTSSFWNDFRLRK